MYSSTITLISYIKITHTKKFILLLSSYVPPYSSLGKALKLAARRLRRRNGGAGTLGGKALATDSTWQISTGARTWIEIGNEKSTDRWLNGDGKLPDPAMMTFGHGRNGDWTRFMWSKPFGSGGVLVAEISFSSSNGDGVAAFFWIGIALADGVPGMAFSWACAEKKFC